VEGVAGRIFRMSDPESPINPAEDIEDEGNTDPLLDMG